MDLDVNVCFREGGRVRVTCIWHIVGVGEAGGVDAIFTAGVASDTLMNQREATEHRVKGVPTVSRLDRGGGGREDRRRTRRSLSLLTVIGPGSCGAGWRIGLPVRLLLLLFD